MIISKRIILICMIGWVSLAACSSPKASNQTPIERIIKLPEVQKYARDIRRINDSARVAFRKEQLPDNPNIVITVGEDQTTHYITWRRFIVNSETGEIMVEDIPTGENISLSAWRSKNN